MSPKRALMKRTMCENCEYPKVTCICEHVEQVAHNVQIMVLQHPSETSNKKNTVRLLKLISTNTVLIQGKTEVDFSKLQILVRQNPQSFALLYPSKKAIEISEKYLKQIKSLILIDGTWKQSNNIFYQNPWLQELPHLTFKKDITSRYSIRCGHVQGGLSSIESAAYGLQAIEGISIEPFVNALDGFKRAFTKYMPDKVKIRYK